jgi:hypothetical protein
MVRSLLPASHVGVAKAPPVGAVATPSHPSLPIIVNAHAALQSLVEHFENHLDLTKEVFVERVRNSQTSSR